MKIAFVYNQKYFKYIHHHLDNFISFPLIYRFVGNRCVLTKLHTKNWKHRSRWTVTLTDADAAKCSSQNRIASVFSNGSSGDMFALALLHNFAMWCQTSLLKFASLIFAAIFLTRLSSRAIFESRKPRNLSLAKISVNKVHCKRKIAFMPGTLAKGRQAVWVHTHVHYLISTGSF